MQRLAITPRQDWQRKVEEYGLTFHTIDGAIYWDESACYQFTSAEVDLLDDATAELHRLCLAAVEEVIRRDRFAQFQIPAEYVSLVKKSWEKREPSLYGRFDLAYDGTGTPRLLEYNADTPTALLEASVIQWFWLQDTFPDADQFNSIHERLLERFQWLNRTVYTADNAIFFFASVDGHEEDYMNVNYLRDVAAQAGFATDYLPVEQIGWNSGRERFVDLNERPISLLFKLYPWEWLVREQFGPFLLTDRTQFFEPEWKMILSNKAILPLLWEMFPNHPNLLRAEWAPFGTSYVKKPILAREGANITLVVNGSTVHSTSGRYTEFPCIYQEWYRLPEFVGNYPVIGSWMVGDTPCGIGIREDRTPVTQDTSRFVPHLFRP